MRKNLETIPGPKVCKGYRVDGASEFVANKQQTKKARIVSRGRFLDRYGLEERGASRELYRHLWMRRHGRSIAQL